MRIVTRWEWDDRVKYGVVVEMVAPVCLWTWRHAVEFCHWFGGCLGATHESHGDDYGKVSHARYTRAALGLFILALLAGCAHVQPIPCEELETATATGGRNYAWLCPPTDETA